MGIHQENAPMKFYSILLFFLLYSNCLAAATDCEQGYDPQRDYFPDKTNLRYATGFTVEYFKHYKVVTVLTPWPGAKETFRYVLVQCGAPAPDGYANAQRIEIPVRRVAAMSTTQLPHLELLGEVGRLVAVSDIKPVNSTAVNQRFQAGQLSEIGHGTSVELESVVELETDLVMAVATAQSQYNAHPVLLQAGIAVALNAEYTEASLLGRTEWLKYTALFFNKEHKAQQHVDAIAAQYETYAAKTRQLSPAQRPTVFGGALWRGTWYISGGKSYPAQLLHDAGGRYVWGDDTSRSSLPLDFEAVYEKAHTADIWLPQRNEWHNLEDAARADERYADLAAYKNGRVFNANARLNEHGGNDYWENGIAEPHILLADLIKIIHPQLLPEHQLKFYKALD